MWISGRKLPYSWYISTTVILRMFVNRQEKIQTITYSAVSDLFYLLLITSLIIFYRDFICKKGCQQGFYLFLTYQNLVTNIQLNNAQTYSVFTFSLVNTTTCQCVMQFQLDSHICNMTSLIFPYIKQDYFLKSDQWYCHFNHVCLLMQRSVNLCNTFINILFPRTVMHNFFNLHQVQSRKSMVRLGLTLASWLPFIMGQ